ncbi:putative transcriptional regulator [Hoeflea phototrophica DFL-43]|jgi:DNA-binding transcriptional MerR regulator|uniref:Putative transcriptional regulator n=1 Tax=Hoeflea phototrophica (strain DSM 17068 / NCIMB 14078 / DFL-43) TaxID=411684 RepID=A9D4M6_HOEPD|nr:MerR family transcriptional regulator [Hoeflea phototrophica]EDQ33909.1 putative transcriptional regulator [Hoeflea phototrophica DFL-43]
MDKSPDAFRTISEVADDLDLPQHVLRFWETRFTQIKPMKRGGGRRYYRPDDVELLKGIRTLLYDQGYTIKGVQKLLKQNGNKFVIAIGSGDMAAVEALSTSIAEDKPPAPRAAAGAEEDQLVGKARLPSTRRFFGLGGDAGKPGEEAHEPDSKAGMSRDDRALLQEALYDLLECKRLLDQVR